MFTIEDLYRFGPFAIVALCLGVGKVMSSSKSIPNWLIPPVLSGLGLLSGCAAAAASGGDWRAWLTSALVGTLSGAGAVGLHQAGRSVSRQDTGAPGDAPHMGLTAPGAGAGTARGLYAGLDVLEMTVSTSDIDLTTAANVAGPCRTLHAITGGTLVVVPASSGGATRTLVLSAGETLSLMVSTIKSTNSGSGALQLRVTW
jgi:hypothetical protein